MSSDLFAFDDPSRSQHDDGCDLFTKDGVGHAHDCAVRDVGVLEDGGFHHHRVDVLTSSNDHVFFAIDDVDEALIVDSRDVPCAQPALGKALAVSSGLFQ